MMTSDLSPEIAGEAAPLGQRGGNGKQNPAALFKNIFCSPSPGTPAGCRIRRDLVLAEPKGR
jgi:hypothetical protein